MLNQHLYCLVLRSVFLNLPSLSPHTRNPEPFLPEICRWVSAKRHNSIANALELRLSCTKPSMWDPDFFITVSADVRCWAISRPWWRHQMETFSALLAFVRGIHRSPVNSPHKGQWRGALMFTLICARINGWVNNGEAGDLRRNRAHYDVIVMHSVDRKIRRFFYIVSWTISNFECGIFGNKATLFKINDDILGNIAALIPVRSNIVGLCAFSLTISGILG